LEREPLLLVGIKKEAMYYVEGVGGEVFTSEKGNVLPVAMEKVLR